MNKNLDIILQSLFKHQLQIKMFHFQTKKFGGHKASDDYLSKFENNLDEFMEVAQGHFGKLETRTIEIAFDTLNDNNIIEALGDFINILKSLSGPLREYTDLLNLRDEMIGDASKLRYLLTFN